ncbi:MAG: hypothetical protein OXB90_08510 [Acidimicrobiaceae bacterium]|nr:hypothetical protein [Acidimicrobiaceae bacterium]
MKAAVVFGGPSPEHDISILTGLQAARVLSDAGTDTNLIYWTKQAKFESVPATAESKDFLGTDRPGFAELAFSIQHGFVMPSRLRRQASLEFDVVLNCCHGGPGEDGSLDSMLRLAGFRVTGPNASACALFMDKLATTALADSLGIATIPSVGYSHSAAPAVEAAGNDNIAPPFDPPLPHPWVAKPRFGGSSIGVEVGVVDVATLNTLAKGTTARSGLVVQPYLAGWFDLNIAVRCYPKLQVSVIERPLADGVYDYSTKYLSGTQGMESAPRELPAQLPSEVRTIIEAAATKLALTMPVTGIPRVDFLWDGKETVLFNEINPIPGAFGMYLWSPLGISRETLLLDLLQEAASHPTHPGSWNANSDGAALRAAANIATKLA